jgi:hypothetical protein
MWLRIWHFKSSIILNKIIKPWSPLIIWWYKIWNPPFIGKNCFGSFALVFHGYVLHLGFAKMRSSSLLHKECQYICKEMLGFFVCDTHKITIAYLVILVFWFHWNWHTMVYLQSVFLLWRAWRSDCAWKTCSAFRRFHIPSTTPLCRLLGAFGLGSSFLNDKLIRPANLFDQTSHFSWDHELLAWRNSITLC